MPKCVEYDMQYICTKTATSNLLYKNGLIVIGIGVILKDVCDN